MIFWHNKENVRFAALLVAGKARIEAPSDSLWTDPTWQDMTGAAPGGEREATFRESALRDMTRRCVDLVRVLGVELGEDKRRAPSSYVSHSAGPLHSKWIN